jgi:sirohydrochlorin cobaltochelatase
MWQTFCELALYGGPPHRGEDDAVDEPGAGSQVIPSELLTELQRGIFETTGLETSPADSGWLAVSCGSKRMAAWMSAAIILENVDARCDGEILLLPAAAGFELENQVKSVVTVVAKVNHYWQAHLMGKEPTSK